MMQELKYNASIKNKEVKIKLKIKNTMKKNIIKKLIVGITSLGDNRNSLK